MKDKTPILDFETCERIGTNTEDAIFARTKQRLNNLHPSGTGMSYYDSLALDINHSEELLSAGDTPAKTEVLDILREEYRNLDELERHCLFLYLGSSEKEETEMINDLAWHFEETLMNRADAILSPTRTQNKMKS